MPVLSADDLESFTDLGWCKVERAFDEDAAAAARAVVWERLAARKGIRQDDPSTWPEFYDPEEHIDAPEVVACFTDRLATAIEELVGVGRWAGRRRWGLWPINFSLGGDRPWALPLQGWHIDGNWFRHTLDCPRQGLLVIGLFSDVGPQGGGTLLAQGSHKRTARVLAKHPDGLTHRQVFDEVLSEPIGDIVEATGRAGDVYLGHPWLFHTRNMNKSGRPRFMSNTEAGLHAPMSFRRADGAYSVLERSILRALEEPPRPPRNPLRVRF